MPYITSSEYEAAAHDVTATCNRAHLGTQSIENSTGHAYTSSRVHEMMSFLLRRLEWEWDNPITRHQNMQSKRQETCLAKQSFL